MTIVVSAGATIVQVRHILEVARQGGWEPYLVKESERVIVGVAKGKPSCQAASFEALPGVERVVASAKHFRLAGKDLRTQPTIVDVDGVNRPIGSLGRWIGTVNHHSGVGGH